MNYFYFDVETCPMDKKEYLSKDDEERKKLMNPIDSKIIAIGVKQNGKDIAIFHGENEKQILDDFWTELATFRKGDLSNKLVGFNIKNFDLPFVVTRSFIHNVQIVPFVLKDVVDLRENLSAFKYGHVRGKLKEFAEHVGIEIMTDIGGETIAEEYWAGNLEKIKEYLKKDLEITESIHKRIVDLRLHEIRKW